MALKICSRESPKPLIYRRVGIAHQPEISDIHLKSNVVELSWVRSRHEACQKRRQRLLQTLKSVAFTLSQGGFCEEVIGGILDL